MHTDDDEAVIHPGLSGVLAPVLHEDDLPPLHGSHAVGTPMN